ncbi:MAG: hypothetical protein NC131_21460, partial [Roseburia sp.]|nr:hypothetical protein [Roseburia sp.]
KKIDRRFYEVVLYTVDNTVFYPQLVKELGENQINFLWGAGARGTHWVKWFQNAGIIIEGIVDKNSSYWGNFIEGIPVYPPEILENKDCNVIITPEKYVEEIKKEISKIDSGCIYIFELDILCKRLAESVLGLTCLC